MRKLYTSDFLQESYARGFIYQGTDLDALDAAMCATPVTAYLGFDPTGDSLHVGSLVQIMWLRLLQKHGHRPLVLLGDGTSRIGDPSGKDTERILLSEADIEKNSQGISKIFDRFLSFGTGANPACFLRNAEWLTTLAYLDFLRAYGRHFSINRMLALDSVRLRLEREQNLSFLEFNYMILQAYDFLWLYQHHSCVLQLGGSDQWGNILCGTELIRRVLQGQAYGITAPLITTADGKKMGKTEQGAVWLNAEKFSSFNYWQFWRNTQDADVPRFLRLFTDLPLSEIERLDKLKGAEINEAKKILANEATRLCHGSEAVEEAVKTAEGLFAPGHTLEWGEASLPTFEVSETELQAGLMLVECFVQTGLCSSRGDARRLIRGGGAKLNDQKILIEDQKALPSDFVDGLFLKLSSGRKRHALIKVRR